jgi:hypothetical protein
MSADAMLFMCTFFPTQQAFSKSEQKITMPTLADRIRGECAPTKDELSWCKLGFFGDKRTDKNCLRSNANLRWVSGVEFYYDQEKISFDEAVNILDSAGVMSIVYTTASHTVAKPRWRVLAPFTLGQQCDQRNKYLARLNGLFHGTVSNESWTLSQAFYYGSVGDKPTHSVEEIYGFCIDQLDELDATAIGKLARARTPGNIGDEAGFDAIADSELIRQVVTTEGLHPALCALAARFIGRGMRPDTVAEQLRGFMLATPEAARDERWHNRYGQIPSLVDSAVPKFADDDRRAAGTALAKLLFRMVKQQASQEKIEAAAFAEGERLGLSRAEVCHVAAWVAAKEAA